MDLTQISTLSQLADALKGLRRARSLSLQDLADAAAKLPTRGGRRPALPRSTASDLLNAKSVPEAETLVTFLAACGIHDEDAQQPWLQALDRVANSHQQRPPGAVRVRDVRPRVLGVHAAIQAGQQPENARLGPAEGELPLYVPRDFDADLRTKLTLAHHQGGFALLVGDSSVGKTRALLEAVQAVLPDWWLLHPNDAEALRKFAAHPTGRTVVWLDELQDYLDFAGGVPAGQVRELIAAGVVLVATCWPGEHSKRVTLPDEERPDPYANDRRLLDLADVLHVPAAFSTHERCRAEELAATDRRIRIALDTPDAGFTQVMAAGPELIRHWTQAPAYAKAVITAALDARRVGAHAPITSGYLADAVPGYLNEREVATAPSAWLKQALDYATKLLHGATAPLTPVPAGMGSVAGYQVADYLHQHALRTRRREPLPDTAWHALIRHHHPDDTGRIADNARRRGRDHEALTLYEQLADRGDEHAARRLAELLVERGGINQLRTRADRGDGLAAEELVRQLAAQGQVEELRERADCGDDDAAVLLAQSLAAQGQVDDAIQVLRAHIDYAHAATEFARLLAERGQVDAAIDLLRAHADRGDEDAATELVDLLTAHREVEQLRALAARGDEYAAVELADLLTKQGQVEDAIRVLSPHADDGRGYAAVNLAVLLATQGQVEDAVEVLRPRADKGDVIAAARLADLLVTHGKVGQLHERANNGDEYAMYRVAELLVAQGQEEQLQERANNGDIGAAYRLADLLAEREQVDDAIEVLRLGADNGHRSAAVRLADLLVKQGRVEDAIPLLCVSADSGNVHAAAQLARLAARGLVENAIQLLRDRADNGDRHAALELTDQLVERGQIKELEREVAAGTVGAVAALRRARPEWPTRSD